MDASSDYYDSSDFKRDRRVENEEEYETTNLKNSEYIKELIKERNNLESDSHASRLLDLGKSCFSGENFFSDVCKIY
jgi:hypothetical protein